jgi:hypothetical protein
MKIDQLVTEEVSGSLAKGYVTDITRYHRIQASTMFHDAAEHVRSELKKMDLKDAKIERFTADGKHNYWTYTSPVGWEARSAELVLLEPERRVLASYQDCPQSLHTYSKGTSKEGVVAQLIDVGGGTDAKDYAGKKVRGRLVLASGRAMPVHEEAVRKRGAAGVITDTMPYEFPGVRESLDVPDAHAYQGIWPNAKTLNKLAFGFSLSKRQGDYLRGLLKSGKKVELKATVDARLFPAYEEVVTATIKGSELPGEEIFVIAHLCHPKPGANDNASGSGAVLEIARTITTLVRTGKIARPRRTIRFMWVPETLGTVAYLAAHDDVPSRFVAGINLDMVGEDQEKCGSTLQMTKTPDSLPSFLNDYMTDVYERSLKSLDRLVGLGLVSKFRFSASTFSGGSDHAEFTTSTTRVPCVSFTQWPDKFYHTSMDTMDNVSEDSMRRICWVGAVGALELANANAEKVILMAALTAANGAKRLKEAGKASVRALFDAVEDATGKGRKLPDELLVIGAEGRSRIAHIEDREKRAVESVERLGKSKTASAFVKRRQDELETIADQEVAKLDEVLAQVAAQASVKLPKRVPEPRATKELRRLTPHKLFKGTLNHDLLKERLGRKRFERHKAMADKDRDFENKSMEALNYMDGKRTGADILEVVSAEYGRTEPGALLELLKDLERAGLVKLR